LVGDEAGDWAIVEVVLNNNAATIITENKFNLKRPIFLQFFSDLFKIQRELKKKSVCFVEIEIDRVKCVLEWE
jgi:hypothetical protein